MATRQYFTSILKIRFLAKNAILWNFGVGGLNNGRLLGNTDRWLFIDVEIVQELSTAYFFSHCW